MVINKVKTKEVIFHKPYPQRFHVNSPDSIIGGVERVSRIKLGLLGVIVQESFSVFQLYKPVGDWFAR